MVDCPTASSLYISHDIIVLFDSLPSIAEQYDIHPVQITDWKTPLAERAGWVFAKGKRPSTGEAAVKALQAKIGALTMERDCLERGLGRMHGPKGQPW